MVSSKGTLIRKLPFLSAEKPVVEEEFHIKVLLYQLIVVSYHPATLYNEFSIVLLYHPIIDE